LALTRGRLTVYEGAGDIGLIAVYRATAVHQYDRALAHRLRFPRAVRERGRLVEQNESEFGRAAQLGGGAVHELAEIRRAHAALGARMHATQRLDRDVVRGLHERELGGRLDHAAGADERFARDDLVA